MRLSDKIQRMPISVHDVHRERARSPHARQLCEGSRSQLMEDAEATVQCPKCLKTFSAFDTQKNRDQTCPVVPSHLPDPAGRAEVETAALRRRKNETARPY